MADNERDLLLRARADASQAKQEFSELRDSVTGLTQAEAEQAAASVAASQDTSASFDRQMRASREATEALQGAISAMAEYALVGEEAGVKSEQAFDAARLAVARLSEALAVAEAAGAEVGITAVPMLNAYEAKLGEATIAAESLATAERGETEAELENAAATNEAAAAKLKATEATRMMSAEVGLARGNVGGLARAIGSLVSGPMAQLLLAPLLIEAAFKIIPSILKGIETGAADVGMAFGDMDRSADKVTQTLDKQNETTVKADQQYKKLADSLDLTTRANAALDAGLIQATGSSRLLQIEEMSRQALLHKTVSITEEYVAALKSVGITAIANLDDLKAKEQIFFNYYETLVQTKGIDVANAWAKEHKHAIQAIIDESAGAGEALIPVFEKMADAVGLTSKAYEVNEKAIEKLNKQIDGHVATLKQEYERLQENERETRAAAQTKIDASNESYKVVQKNFELEFAALDDKNRRGELSDRQYRDAFAALQLKEVDDRRLHDAEIDRLRVAADLKVAEEELKAAVSAEKTKALVNDEIEARKAAFETQEKLRQAEHEADMVRDSELSVSSAAMKARFDEHRAAFAELAKAATDHVKLTVEKLKELADQLHTTTGEAKALYIAVAHIGPGDVQMGPGGVPVTTDPVTGE
jgi:hypothetical protein